MLGYWLQGTSNGMKLLALLWAVRYFLVFMVKYINDTELFLKRIYFHVHVIYLIIYWLRTWSILQSLEDRFTGFSCGDVAIIGIGGQGYFFLGTRVMVNMLVRYIAYRHTNMKLVFLKK